MDQENSNYSVDTMNSQLLDRIPVLNRVLGEDYTTKILLWRRRGGSFQPEIHDAVRYRYEDKPNAHVLDTGEEIPAVPLNHIYTMGDGTPFFEAIEVEDGQYAPRDNQLNDENGESKELSIEEVENETSIEVESLTQESRSRLQNLIENKSFTKTGEKTESNIIPLKRTTPASTVDDTVIENKDTRLNFWLDHLKESEEKYGVGGWLKEHMNIILLVVTALAIGILFYTSPISTDAFIQMMSDLVNELQTFNSNFQQFSQSGGLGQ